MATEVRSRRLWRKPVWRNIDLVLAPTRSPSATLPVGGGVVAEGGRCALVGVDEFGTGRGGDGVEPVLLEHVEDAQPRGGLRVGLLAGDGGSPIGLAEGVVGVRAHLRDRRVDAYAGLGERLLD